MMERKSNQKNGFAVRFTENPLISKILYGIVAGILIVSAIVIGIVSSGNRKQKPTAPAEDTQNAAPQGDEGKLPAPPPAEDKPKKETPPAPEAQTFVSPVVGRVIKSHSDSVPVYSITLEDYRTHTGLDISTDEGAKVYAAAAGTVSRLYKDPLLGYTVELTHEDGVKTVYSNLDKSCLTSLAVGQKLSSGAQVGVVGDSSISELCDEPHLHFEMLVNGKSVDPLEHLSEASQKTSLGIVRESL